MEPDWKECNARSIDFLANCVRLCDYRLNDSVDVTVYFDASEVTHYKVSHYEDGRQWWRKSSLHRVAVVSK